MTFVTGAAPYLGSALMHDLIPHTDHKVLEPEVLTFGSSLATLAR